MISISISILNEKGEALAKGVSYDNKTPVEVICTKRGKPTMVQYSLLGAKTSGKFYFDEGDEFIDIGDSITIEPAGKSRSFVELKGIST